MDHRLGQAIRAADKILREWLGVKKGQKLLFMANPATERDVIDAFLAAAGELEAEAFVFIKKPHADNLEEYPRPLAEAIKYVDIYFNFCTLTHCNHTLSHLTAVTEYGTRYFMFHNPTIDKLLAYTQVSADELRQRGDYLARELLGQKVKITSKNGTDLSLEFDKDVTNPVYNSTFERGGLAGIPGGAQHFHPKDGSINGVIVPDVIHGFGETGPSKVRFTITKDWITDVAGGPENLAKKLGDEMKSVKNASYIGEVGFGLNPQLKPGLKSAGGYTPNSRIEGSMHIGTGESIWYGGRINCPILRIHTVYSPRIEANGKVIVENNKFFL